jgi:hypothetical protein
MFGRLRAQLGESADCFFTVQGREITFETHSGHHWPHDDKPLLNRYAKRLPDGSIDRSIDRSIATRLIGCSSLSVNSAHCAARAGARWHAQASCFLQMQRHAIRSCVPTVVSSLGRGTRQMIR